MQKPYPMLASPSSDQVIVFHLCPMAEWHFQSVSFSLHIVLYTVCMTAKWKTQNVRKLNRSIREYKEHNVPNSVRNKMGWRDSWIWTFYYIPVQITWTWRKIGSKKKNICIYIFVCIIVIKHTFIGFEVLHICVGPNCCVKIYNIEEIKHIV